MYTKQILEQKQKLEGLQKLQNRMKAINKVCRSKKHTDEEKKAKLKADYNLSESDCLSLLNPRFSYQKKGFQSYETSNNAATIRNTKKRIAELERRQKALEEAERNGGTKELFKNEDFGIEAFTDFEDERVRITFEEKPIEDVRKILKSNGFKWSPYNEAWQRKYTAQAERDTKYVCEKIVEEFAMVC